MSPEQTAPRADVRHAGAVPDFTIDAARSVPAVGQDDPPMEVWVAVTAPTYDACGDPEAQLAAARYAARKWGGTWGGRGRHGPMQDDAKARAPGNTGDVTAEGATSADQYRQIAARMVMPSGPTKFVCFHNLSREDLV